MYVVKDLHELSWHLNFIKPRKEAVHVFYYLHISVFIVLLLQIKRDNQ